MGDTLQLWALVSSIVSVILALVAISLSFAFFWVSLRSSRGIGETAARLEEVVGILHRDTFSTLKDTYSEVLKHSWTGAQPSQDDLSKEIDRRADEKFAALLDGVNTQIESLLSQQERTASDASELRELVETALHRSRKIEEQAREETLHERMASALPGFLEGEGKRTAQELYNTLSRDGNLNVPRFCEELFALRERGRLQFDVSRDDESSKWVPTGTVLRRPNS